MSRPWLKKNVDLFKIIFEAIGLAPSHLPVSLLVEPDALLLRNLNIFCLNANVTTHINMSCFSCSGGKRNNFSTCKAKAAATGPLLEMEAC